MNLAHLTSFPAEKGRALFGLTATAVGALLAAVLPDLLRRRGAAPAQRSDRQRAVGGGRRRRLRPSQEGLLRLSSWRHNVAPAGVGALCGVRAATSENTFDAVGCVRRAVCPAPRGDAEKTGKNGAPSWTPDKVEGAVIDSCEAPGRRPSLPERQKRGYAGKQKRPTLTSPVVPTATGETSTLLLLSGDQRPLHGSTNRARGRSAIRMPSSRATGPTKGALG